MLQSCQAAGLQRNAVPLVVVEEHREAYFVVAWAVKSGLLSPRGNALLHIDDHHDLAWPVLFGQADFCSQSLSDIAVCTFEQLRVCDFLVPMIHQGLFREIYWLRRGGLHPQSVALDTRVEHFGKIFYYYCRHIGGQEASTPRTFPILRTITPDATIVNDRPMVLDIDLDYFSSCDATGETCRIEITKDEYTAFLIDRRHQWKLMFGSRTRVTEEAGRYFLIYNALDGPPASRWQDQDQIRDSVAKLKTSSEGVRSYQLWWSYPAPGIAALLHLNRLHMEPRGQTFTFDAIWATPAPSWQGHCGWNTKVLSITLPVGETRNRTSSSMRGTVYGSLRFSVMWLPDTASSVMPILLTNHYHLLIETPEANLSRGMQLLNGVYTQWFNRRHGRVGHLFKGRFKAILVEKESHLLELARYVVLNPVRAKLVRTVQGWPWTSFRATSGQSDVPELLTVDWILSQFGPDRARAVRAYRRFVSEGKGVDVWEELRAGAFLGTDAFVKQLAPLLAEKPPDPEIRKEERFAARPSLEELFSGISDKAMRNERIHQAVRAYHYKLREVGEFWGLHFSTISVIAKRASEAKENQK